jgi:hypothetical protein
MKKSGIVTNVRLSYGELKRLVLNELKQVDAEVFELDSADILNGCLEKTGKSPSKNTHNGIWMPYQHAKTFRTPKLQSLHSKMSDILGDVWDFTPKQALAVLKVGSVDVEIGDGNLMTFVPSPSCREHVYNQMARLIVARFKSLDIDAVISASSSSEMASSIALKVAEWLPDASFITDAVLKKAAHEVEVDERRFSAWKAKVKPAPENASLYRAHIDNVVDATKRSGKLPTAKGTDHQYREFFNFHKPGPTISRLANKTVLVIDDNVDKGWTSAGIEELLHAAGVGQKNVWHAAGFDYADRTNDRAYEKVGKVG